MDFKNLVLKRESCRHYDPAISVTKNDMIDIIKTATMAPSACNSQPWHFVLVQGAKSKPIPKLLQGAGFNKFADDISTFIIVCETKAKLIGDLTFDQQHFAQLDVGSAFSYLDLAANDKGIATCIMGCFDEEELKIIYSIPYKIRAVVGFGYSTTPIPRQKRRKPLEEVLTIIE